MKQVAEAIKGSCPLAKELQWIERVEKPPAKINFSFKPKLTPGRELEVNVGHLKEGANLFETIMTQKKRE